MEEKSSRKDILIILLELFRRRKIKEAGMVTFIDLDKQDQSERFPENSLIIIDDGDTFKGSPKQFEECFFPKATPDGLEEFRREFDGNIGLDGKPLKVKIEVLVKN
jgi:hypothetical protein